MGQKTAVERRDKKVTKQKEKHIQTFITVQASGLSCLVVPSPQRTGLAIDRAKRIGISPLRAGWSQRQRRQTKKQCSSERGKKKTINWREEKRNKQTKRHVRKQLTPSGASYKP
jgi:hypothetical protein